MTKTPDLESNLAPTELIDLQNPIVQKTSKQLTEGCTSEVEKIKRIYHFVRDEIPYTFTHNQQKASEVLIDKIGQCNTKTTLTIALLRAAHIPARYHCGSISKSLFQNIIPRWAYPFTPSIIPGHCWPEVWMNGEWIAIENVMDMDLYEGIQRQIFDKEKPASIGCGLSADTFQREWDGQTPVLMQEGALKEDAGTFSNADDYLAYAEKFLNPFKYWLKNKLVKGAMNRKFQELRNTKSIGTD